MLGWLEGRDLAGRSWGWWLSVWGAAVLVVGPLGPWARILHLFTVDGIDVNGKYVLGCGVLILVLTVALDSTDTSARAWPAWTSAVLAGVALALCVYDWARVARVAREADNALFSGSDVVSVGWALQLCAVAGLALVAASVLRALALARRDGVTAPET